MFYFPSVCFCLAARRGSGATYTRAAEAGPACREAPGPVRAGADEPELRRFHPETCTPGVGRIPATTGLLARQSEAARTESFQRLVNSSERFTESFFLFILFENADVSPVQEVQR